MKQNRLIYLAILSLVMIGCTQDEPIVVPKASEQSVAANEHRVSLQDALKRAESLLSQIGDPATRSKTRKVESVEYLQNRLTRSGAIDTTLYLVNYENNGGFALLGADNRVRPIYAISDEGRLNLEDTIENKGLAMFFRNTEAEIANTPLLPPGLGDSLTLIDPPNIDPPYHEVVVYRQVEPLLGPNQRLWDQDYPYNLYCPIVDGATAFVGCAAVAVGQIMSYYQWPTSIGSETFPWQAMNAGNADERVAKFLRILGYSDHLNISYHSDDNIGSGSSPDRPRTAFRNLGYLDPGNFQDFNENNIVSILLKGKNNQRGGGPVYVRGYTDLNSGHAWVIDGFLQYKVISNQIVGGEQIQNVLHHCVWGWGGMSNGYFYWAYTNSFSGNPIEKDYEFQINDPGLDYGVRVSYLGGFIPNY